MEVYLGTMNFLVMVSVISGDTVDYRAIDILMCGGDLHYRILSF